jgi:hypothetical protein
MAHSVPKPRSVHTTHPSAPLEGAGQGGVIPVEHGSKQGLSARVCARELTAHMLPCLDELLRQEHWHGNTTHALRATRGGVVGLAREEAEPVVVDVVQVREVLEAGWHRIAARHARLVLLHGLLLWAEHGTPTAIIRLPRCDPVAVHRELEGLRGEGGHLLAAAHGGLGGRMQQSATAWEGEQGRNEWHVPQWLGR